MKKILLLNGGKDFLHSKGQLNTYLQGVAKETLLDLGKEVKETVIDKGYDAKQ